MEKTPDTSVTRHSASIIASQTPGAPISIQEEPVQGPAKEGDSDAFWLILRELRVISEKLNTLVTGTEPVGFKKNSDKSYH